MSDICALVVSYNYPPGPPVGCERVLKFQKYLHEFGVRTVTLASRVWGPLPTDRERDVHRPVEPSLVYRYFLRKLLRRGERVAAPAGHGMSAGTKLQPLRDWLLRTVLIPDLHILWFPTSVLEGVRLVRKRRVDVIVSTSGPETNHLVALAIAFLTRKPLIADFRDGWLFETLKEVLRTKGWRRRVEGFLEKVVARRAAAIVTVSDPLTRYFADTYRLDETRAVTITHGFDPDEWADVEPVERADGKMRFVHTGAFSQSRTTLDITSFLAGLSLLPRDLTDRIEVLFIGSLTAAEREAIDRMGEGRCVQVVAPVPRAKSLGYQMSADALLLIYAPELSGASTKTFEYLYSGRPILAVGLPDSAGVRIIADACAGRTADVREPRQIAERIAEMFDLWQQGRLTAGRRDIDRYHRRALAGRLADVVKRVAARS